jgi:histidyl-tRNA synthetase
MYQLLRGTKDILPEEAAKWQLVERKAAEVFSLYGFREIRTPIMEQTSLFERSIGASTDIVNKEMFTFKKGEDSITLRPENTAPVVRAYVQHSLHRKRGRQRYYYIGPMFRYERPQKGRQRQFHQIGIEVFNEKSPTVDAESIEMAAHFLGEIGIEPFRVVVNSVGCPACRVDYREVLQQYLQPIGDVLCSDCLRRSSENPMRTFDCKKEDCQDKLEKAPSILDYLCEECSSHFTCVQEYLQLADIEYQVHPRLVRGLDYYVKTAFEIYSESLGAQNSILGGGRYDRLVQELGGPDIPGFGFAAGLDRIIMILPEQLAEESKSGPDLFIASIGEAGLKKGAQLCKNLRRKGIFVIMDFEGKSLQAQMRKANRESAHFVLFMGDDEIKRGQYTLRNMHSGEQKTIQDNEIERFREAFDA